MITSEQIVEARRVFRRAFAERGHGSFHDTYVSNVAMLLHDRHGLTEYEARNRAATEILDLIFGVSDE